MIPAGRNLNYVQAEVTQGIYIIVDTLPLSRNSVGLQMVNNLPHGNRVPFIGIMEQEVHHIENLQSMIG